MRGLDPDLRALQDVRDCVARAKGAQALVARWNQAQVDALCEAVVAAGARAAHELARAAVEETGIGRVHYKVLKNLFGTEGVWASIRDEKTVGIVSRDEARGVIEVATPAGVIACIVPTTNPTSTALHNALVSIKGRNAAVLSPHPRSKRCIAQTVEVMRTAIERAGGPPDLVQSLESPTIESTGALMKHKDVAMILATGGSGLVHAAYSSGKPAYGVGPGNVPCYIDRSADVESAARWITASQSFDNGTLCCSEQALVVDRPIAERLLGELQKRGAHVCNEEETAKLAAHCNVRGHMNPDVVGLDPVRVAERAGFHVPRSTTILLAYQGGVGREWPLAIEILCPVLSVHLVDGWEEGCEVSLATLHADGLGHTIGLWARDEHVLDAWFLEKPANRIVVNGPTSEGAVGYSTNLDPSMSLGCGPQAGNITSDNITARHLVNVKRVGFPKRDWEAIYVANHARAAGFTGDAAPRGSGLSGDPGLRGHTAAPTPSPANLPAVASMPTASAPAAPLQSWSGNPPSAQAPSARAPRFTGSSASGSKSAAPRETLRPAPRAEPPRAAAQPSGGQAGASSSVRATGPYVGMSLTPQEIQGILAHAGSGCPLGPCKGCPHNDVKTGACTA